MHVVSNFRATNEDLLASVSTSTSTVYSLNVMLGGILQSRSFLYGNGGLGPFQMNSDTDVPTHQMNWTLQSTVPDLGPDP